MKLKTLFILTMSLITFHGINAQNPHLEKANLEFGNEGYDLAARYYKMAYKKEKEIDTKAMILFQIGECYKSINRHPDANNYFKKAITAKYQRQDPIVYFSYGESLQEQGDYEEALIQFAKYKDNGGDESLANFSILEAENAVLKLTESESRYEVDLMPSLCSEYNDYAPMISSNKGDELIFTSSRVASIGDDADPITGENFTDLYIVERDRKKKWETPKNLGNTLNTTSHEGAASFSDRKDIMYFTKCEVTKDDRFGCDIYWAKRKTTNFGPATLVPIREKIDDTTRVGHPFMIKGGEVMLFAGNLPGGYGGKDLYYITYDRKDDLWGKPVNLGSEINTSEDETYPFVRMDGALYFSSNGHSGFGGRDVFRAETAGDLIWADVTNLEYPINSSADDFGLSFDGDEDKGYFTSNRSGGKGMDDIYSFKMPPLEFILDAIVYNADTGEPIPGVQLILNGTDNSSYDLKTDNDGGIMLENSEIKEAASYTVSISLDNFFAISDRFSTVELERSTTFIKEYFLEPIEDKTYPFPEVHYPYGSPELLVDEKVNSRDSLDYLVELLNDNPNLTIELQAHTDTRGTTKENMELSQRRAETCKDYLISRGISSERLESKGFGESDPIISDSQIGTMLTKEEKDAGHAKNRRTVFNILRLDYFEKK